MFEQITFAGYRTYDDLGLVLMDAPELSPPEVKTDIIDVPGGDGTIDLSEFSGDVRYGERKIKLAFFADGVDTPQAIEQKKTDLSRKLHGIRSPFTLSWDPGFTYTGRAAITDYPNGYRFLVVELEIAADPYKYAGTQTWRVNGAGGVQVVIPCGRKRWCPKFQVERETLVSFEGTGWTLQPGTWTIGDLYLRPGDNVLTVNTDPGYGSATWNDFTSTTWAQLHSTYTYWYEVAAGSSPRQVPLTWNDLSGDKWSDYPDTRWVELVHDADGDPTYAAFIQTEIYEL